MQNLKIDRACENCKDKFIETSSGYKRFSLSGRLRNTGLTVKEGLALLLLSKSILSTPESSKRPTDFICQTCFNLLNIAVAGHKAKEEFFARTKEESYVGVNSVKKRKIVPSTPAESPKGKRRNVLVNVIGTIPFQDKPNAGGKLIKRRGASAWKKKAKELMMESRYKQMVLLLYSHSPYAAKKINAAVQKLVKREVSGFGMCNRLIGKPVTIQNIEEFNWERVLEEFNDHLPLLFHAVTGACSNEETSDIVKDKKIASRTGIGKMMSTALYIRKPQRYKFLPAVHGVELWRSGASPRVFELFNQLGLTTGKSGTRSTVNRLRTPYDPMILDLKRPIEVENRLRTTYEPMILALKTQIEVEDRPRTPDDAMLLDLKTPIEVEDRLWTTDDPMTLYLKTPIEVEDRPRTTDDAMILDLKTPIEPISEVENGLENTCNTKIDSESDPDTDITLGDTAASIQKDSLAQSTSGSH